MSATGSPRYGVDGYPYLIGLATITGASATAAAVAGARDRRLLSAALAAVTAICAVPSTLGARYVITGKLQLRDRILAQVDWRGDEVVLDIGAGAGLLGIGAARRAPKGRVHCLDLWVGKDLSGNSSQRLLRNAALEGVSDRVEVRSCDARALDLADACVDVVLSTLCLHNLPDEQGRRAAAREIVRVLRPGGLIVISDLAGTAQLAGWLEADGLVVVDHRRAPGTFPPQRLLVARRPL